MRGAHDAGRGLRAQREAIAAAVVEGVHLLLDDVGELADGALEQLGLLDASARASPRSHSREQVSRVMRSSVLPGADLAGQHVVHAADGLDGRSVMVVGTPSGSAQARRRPRR